jgi:hypothetical protein
MKLNFKNKTNEPQSLNLVDGTSMKIPALGEAVIDSWNIYKEEIERSKIFFDVSLVPFMKEPVREIIIPEKSLGEKIEDKPEVEKPKRTYVRKKKVEEENPEKKFLEFKDTDFIDDTEE